MANSFCAACPGQSRSTTRAPSAAACARVASVECESITTVSSHHASERRQSSMRSASLRVMTQALIGARCGSAVGGDAGIGALVPVRPDGVKHGRDASRRHGATPAPSIRRAHRRALRRGHRFGTRGAMSPRHFLLCSLALAALIWVLTFWDLGAVPLYTVGEPREAVQVVESFDHGEWILPRRNGTDLPSKPPLFHWLGGLTAVRARRVDEWVVRLPSALIAAATLLAVLWFGARRWDAAAGFYAAFVLTSNFEWLRA